MEVRLRDYVDGAALVTDLVLTVAGHRLGDRMTSPGELTEFLDAHQVEHAPAGDAELAGVRALRAELVALFGLADEAEVIAGAVAILDGCPHRLLAGPQHATAKHGDWRLTTTPGASCVDQLRLVAGASLLAVIHALGADRFRDCSSQQCLGMFVDTSNTGQRRFCTPRICGNRVNVARYRARQANSSEPPTTP